MLPGYVASSEQELNIVSDQVHLVLKREELETIVIALRAIALYGFADRIDVILRQSMTDLQ